MTLGNLRRLTDSLVYTHVNTGRVGLRLYYLLCYTEQDVINLSLHTPMKHWPRLADKRREPVFGINVSFSGKTR